MLSILLLETTSYARLFSDQWNDSSWISFKTRWKVSGWAKQIYLKLSSASSRKWSLKNGLVWPLIWSSLMLIWTVWLYLLLVSSNRSNSNSFAENENKRIESWFIIWLTRYSTLSLWRGLDKCVRNESWKHYSLISWKVAHTRHLLAMTKRSLRKSHFVTSPFSESWNSLTLNLSILLLCVE